MTDDDESARFTPIGDPDLRSCGCYRAARRDPDGWTAVKSIACPDHRWVGKDLVGRHGTGLGTDLVDR